MSIGKLNTLINIITTEPVKDADGFTSSVDTTVASVRAYFEQKNSTERWRSMAQNNEVNALFRLRTIPEVELNNRHIIVCKGKRYNIYSVEDIRGRGMYLEILACGQHLTSEV
jgi:SPP1 family predicted phage head-tail adaptor